MRTDFSKFCRKLRIDNDELAKDMARKLGVTPSYLSAIENGKRTIPADWAEEIAKLYKLTPEQMTELSSFCILEHLSDKEKLSLDKAVSVLYFNDSSDYVNGLWDVVRAILGED